MWKFVHVDIELESNGLEFKHLEIESIGLDLVLLQQLSDFLGHNLPRDGEPLALPFLASPSCLLPFLFLLSPNAVPLSTSKPQKRMNKSNPKQIKPTPHSNVFFFSTRTAVRNHMSDLISIA